MMRRPLVSLGFIAALLGVTHRTAASQQPEAADTLRLGALQDAAVGRDPRGRQLDLQATPSAQRLPANRSEWLPQFDATAYARYQSEVVTIPFDRPGEVEPFTPHKDTYDAHLGVRQPLYDPILGARRSVESAQLAESQAQVRTTLFNFRESVAESYFAALLLQAQGAELETGLTDLEAQLRVARGRVEAGDALPSETATLEAELLRRRQSLAEVAADRGAALAVLADLTGRPVREQDALALPDLAQEVAAARAGLASARERPEYAQFARTRETLDRRAAEVGRRNWPRLSAVGRAGVGRPGLNPLGDEFASYWLVGVQLEWSPWDWGRSGLERQALDIQQQIVATEEAAFSETVRRAAIRDLAAIDRLAETLDADSAIIALRERVLGEARLRFSEGVITSNDFVDRETDLLAARLARATHTMELAQARTRFLTLVGIEVP
jgi:outer membrane protein TolC